MPLQNPCFYSIIYLSQDKSRQKYRRFGRRFCPGGPGRDMPLEIRYSRHFAGQKAARSFPDGLAETIVQYPDHRYYDNRNRSLVAVKAIYFAGRERDIAVAYARQGDAVTLLTIHPLKAGQQRRRLESGPVGQL